MVSRVAIVTGANRGLGLAIVSSLCTKFKGDVYLTSRDPRKGQEAIEKLGKISSQVKYHQLDINDDGSIANLKKYVLDRYGGVNVLVNNAGVMVKPDNATNARAVIQTNFHGTRSVSNALFPVIRPHGRVVNVAGYVSQMAMKNCSPEIQDFFRSDVTEEQLANKMNQFVELAESGEHVKNGFADMPYAISKLGVAVLSKIHAKQLREMGKSRVLLNACCPGWIQTDMGGMKAPKKAIDGARTPVDLALLPRDSSEPHGEYISGKRKMKL